MPTAESDDDDYDGGDDLIASLGASLMKEILADLQVDADSDSDTAGWLNLEQLEKELLQLNITSSSEQQQQGLLQQQQPEPFSSAASMVVQRAQQQQQIGVSVPQPVSVQDAWSLSLQKFTASSLEEDFLQADSVRKQQHHQQAYGGIKPPGMDFSKAEEYDETLPVGAPPGMMAAAAASAAAKTETSQQQLLTQAANKLVEQLQQQSAQQHQTVTELLPESAASAISSSATGESVTGVARAPLLTPQNSRSLGYFNNSGAVPATPPPSDANTPAPSRKLSLVESPTTSARQPLPPPPLPTIMPTIPVGVPVMAVPPPLPPPGAVPPQAWQQQPPMPMPPVMMPMPPMMMPPPPLPRIYCNPHPRATPIPASQLESQHMKARDISYVIHSILKPLILAGIPEDSYEVQFFLRRSGTGAVDGTTDKNAKNKDEYLLKQMNSRSLKAKEWSSEQKVLGHVAKTNTARPRALIATMQPSLEDASKNKTEQKQRASLWRARIYCDQAYQAYFSVLEGWKTGGAGAGATGVQAHYSKLFKCLGIAPIVSGGGGSDNTATTADNNSTSNSSQQLFKVDPTPLKLLLKLEKGRILLARILEQALLPPNSVEPLLPAVLAVLLGSSSSSTGKGVGGGGKVHDPSDDRLFVAMARVIQTLPTLSGDTILECVRIIITESSPQSSSSSAGAAGPKAALSSTSRMQCVHALLHRGGAEAQQQQQHGGGGGDGTFQKEWSQAEAEFMKILAGL